MDNSIVGVRFTGPGEGYTDDKYFKTGCVWLLGQVHNFSRNLAKKFFSYPCFEQADVDPSGSTFVASAGRKQPEVAPNINLQAMDTERLVHLARYEFNRVVNPDGKSNDEVRSEVRTLIVMNSLDLAEDEANSNIVRQLSDVEVAALLFPADPLPDVPAQEGDAPVVDVGFAEMVAVLGDDGVVLTKADLADFAMKYFAEKLDKRASIADMRDRVQYLLTNVVPQEAIPAETPGAIDPAMPPADLNELPGEGALHQLPEDVAPVQDAPL